MPHHDRVARCRDVRVAGAGRALLVYVLRLTREERDRSEARAALAELRTAGATDRRWSPEMTSRQTRPRVSRVSAPASTDSRASAALRAFRTSDCEFTPVASERPHAFAHRTPMQRRLRSARSMQDTARDPGARHRRADRGPGADGVIYVWNRLATAPAPQTAEAASRAARARHAAAQRQGDTLVISGLVRNPQDATGDRGTRRGRVRVRSSRARS